MIVGFHAVLAILHNVNSEALDLLGGLGKDPHRIERKLHPCPLRCDAIGRCPAFDIYHREPSVENSRSVKDAVERVGFKAKLPVRPAGIHRRGKCAPGSEVSRQRLGDVQWLLLVRQVA